ncbi:hypothetical protein TCAL_02493 [Tigriopus californicus]|uniref:Glycosyltransferase family 92 protein n=2 Tax=Tigriopus californicus TaxID=6832 RepID=A0A553NTI4_TIGCA|nr:hypothetical protein TCAL_02493 [Tigriopus californicus]
MNHAGIYRYSLSKEQPATFISNHILPSVESDMMSHIALRMPNIPLQFLSDHQLLESSSKGKETCPRIPYIYDLKVQNEQWQEFPTQEGTLHLFRAYYDDREPEPTGSVIRILAMMDRINPKVPLVCQLWFQSKQIEPRLSNVTNVDLIWVRAWGNNRDGILQPYLITCPLPKDSGHEVPVMVSLVEKQCDKAENALFVFNSDLSRHPDHQEALAVCVKGFDIPTDDLSVRIVEWVEMLKVMGVNRLFLYNMAVHPNVQRVLDYYVRDGFVDLTNLSLPGNQPNLDLLRHLYLKHKIIHKRQNEVIPYNDCLYRSLFHYERVALLDFDEMIVPLMDYNWLDLTKRLLSPRPVANLSSPSQTDYSDLSSICFRNVYFMDNMISPDGVTEDQLIQGIPSHFHMLRHVFRARQYSKLGHYSKCFHTVQVIKALHNHFPLRCLSSKKMRRRSSACSSRHVDLSMAHLQHYRSECVAELSSVCEMKYKKNATLSPRILVWKDEIIQRSTRVLSQLNLY